jgi:hypothetical protein
MSELLAVLAFIALVLAVFRISVWLIGIDRAAKLFPGEKKVLKSGCWGVLYVNGETREGWVRMLNWRFCIANGTLFINPVPQLPMLWMLPSLAIPLSELHEISSPGAWFSGGWRRAFVVESAGIKMRLPESISEQISKTARVTSD